MEAKICSKEYNVHYYEIDYKKRLLPTRLIDFFSDVAIFQSEDLKIGLDYIYSRNMAWMLYKWDIKILKYPILGEKITIQTIPYAVKKFYAYRKYKVLNSLGEIIAYADSVWFLVDTIKCRPMKVTQDMIEGYGAEESPKDLYDFGKIEKLESYENQKDYFVRYSDIDTNKHVNNTKYVDWAIESIPLEIIMKYTLKKIKISYEKEVKYGDKIKSFTTVINEDDKIRCLHKIEDSDGKAVTFIESFWEE